MTHNKQQQYTYWQLYRSFFRIGLLTFGGGMAMLPWLEEEMVQYGFDRDDILRIFSLAQSMPGMIATNVPTIIGRELRGFWGSFWATLGVITPSFIIILLIVWGLAPLLDKPSVQGALRAIRSTAAIMILFSAVNLGKKIFQQKKGIRTIISGLILIAIILLSFFTRINPFIFIIGAITLATVEFFIKHKRGKL
ncbi:chromate transporter [Entomospira nematocerorum]|uniref:Chromate transporter n=1 Tax=Entomospira nematocerorum TaxID=2719987 RepID=A0A968GAR0_9SPIO|nr:chromate transporter [Entomospira nematocera]NIZ46432.1 chromate transporter [Entomospira nematocera]WDI33765.1 chromate transporter [Entomospira nematocera]